MSENQNPLCKYKNVFGELGKGIHSYRIMDIAVFDVLITLFLGLWIAWITKYPYYYTIPGIFLLGIVVHRLFCVRTKIDTLLFP